MSQIIVWPDAVRVAAEAREAMRLRCQVATQNFLSTSGLAEPVCRVRFQIQVKGKAFHIVNLSTGKVCGFCFTYRAAQNFVDAMETAANQKLVPRPLQSRGRP
ncbi:hypothetical protein PS3A_03420 [Pseudomonas sp. 3A(2025)]